MTQPIRTFENLMSETATGGNDVAKFDLSFEPRRQLGLRARYARAELMMNGLGDVILWLGRKVGGLVDGVREDFKLRAAEAQLRRMSDHELADIGLCRADIPFAVREVAQGAAPQFDTPAGAVSAANQDWRRAA
jgi:hypothetical protein